MCKSNFIINYPVANVNLLVVRWKNQLITKVHKIYLQVTMNA